MATVVIWVVIIVIFVIATNMKKQKNKDMQRKQQMPAAPRSPQTRPAIPRDLRQAQKTSSEKNVILERAKQNTQDVHASHRAHEEQSRRREYGGGSLTGDGQTVGTGSDFGSPQSGSAASGVPVDENERIRTTKQRLMRELATERADANSKSGRNAIMEAAKENALETRIDNLTDSSRDFMKEVQELMVKGPDDSLPNQRDFVAEGMEMVNNALLM